MDITASKTKVVDWLVRGATTLEGDASCRRGKGAFSPKADGFQI
jgi:hypothetical protein